jgi:hypothetical protein
MKDYIGQLVYDTYFEDSPALGIIVEHVLVGRNLYKIEWIDKNVMIPDSYWTEELIEKGIRNYWKLRKKLGI